MAGKASTLKSAVASYHEPTVSIITPTYNQAQFLEETILSVLQQDYPRIEYIIIDGGSTDGSLEIIGKYANRLAHWVSEPDRGQADAINKGFKRSKGEILGWINSDDTYTPGSISRAVEFFQAHGEAVAVHEGYNIIDESSRILRTFPHPARFRLEDEVRGNILCQPTVLMRRQPVFEVGFLDTTLHHVMDFDLWLKLGLKGAIPSVGGVQASFRIHQGSKSISQLDSFLPEILRVLERFFARADLPPELRSVERLAYSDYYALEAPDPIYRPRHLMTQRQIRHMRRSFCQSIFWYPLRAKTLATIAQICDSYLGTNMSPWVSRFMCALDRRLHIGKSWSGRIET